MTVSEMHNAFRQQVDKSTSLTGSVDFLSEEIDYWLNEAQERFIKQRMFGTNYKQLGFEQGEKRIDDLRTLVVISDKYTLTQSTFASNMKYGSLDPNPTDAPYMYYINSSVYNVSNIQLQSGNVMQEEYVNDYIKDFINNPYIRRPFVLIIGTTISFIHGDEFTPTQYDLTYVRKARTLTINFPGTYETNICELPQQSHKEIVTLAASLVIENIESPRVQTYEQLNASKIE